MAKWKSHRDLVLYAFAVKQIRLDVFDGKITAMQGAFAVNDLRTILCDMAYLGDNG